MPPTISETIPNGKPGRNARASANPLQEYVAGRTSAISAYLNTLPKHVDDIERDFPGIYEQMRKDPQYSSCITLLKLAILARGVDLLPAVPKPGDDADAEALAEYAMAQELTEHCKRQINRLTTPFVYGTLFNLLDCLDHGNKIAECNYEYAKDGPDEGKLVLTSIKVKPRWALSFVVDRFMNVLGLLPTQTGQPAYAGALSGLTLAPGQKILPRKKFLILTCRPVDEDPRGTSIGRPAYHGWWFKQQAWGEWLRTLATFASGNLIGTTAEQAQPLPVEDAAGNPVLDANGLQVFVTPEQAMSAGLEDVRNGSTIVVPFGASVKIERPSGDVGKAFEVAIDTGNREMTTGILGQTRSTMEAEHGSKADSQTGQDVLGILVAHEKTGVEQALRCDVLMPICEWNYGPEYLYLTPRVTLGETAEEDLAELGRTVAALMSAGYFEPEQLPGMDARLGFEVRSEESVEKAKERRDAAPVGPETPDGEDEEEDQP